MIKNALKLVGKTFLGVLLLSLIIVILFIYFSPEFGNAPSSQEITGYEKLDNYKEGVFINLVFTSMDMNAKEMGSTLMDLIKGTPNSKPDFDIPVLKIDSVDLTMSSETRLIWFGHSAFLLQIDGKNILLDPMFGDVPAPHPLLGNPRFSDELPISIEKLPAIDAIILSHDHYDHLDYGSIQKLKNKTKKFYVPLGVAAHLKSWGISPEDIQELNWWDEISYDSIGLAFTPSRHFSGRGLTDRSSTLWGSWVIKGRNSTIFFSGDGGYGPHFKEIGLKYGPFDFAMMECGQYNEKWAQIHMMPEETAQAAVDLNASLMMPIHWGAFTLALHPWTDPVERVIVKARELNMPITTPKIGKFIKIEEGAVANSRWWVKP